MASLAARQVKKPHQIVVIHGQHSQAGKILGIRQELPGRIPIVLIRQQAGF